MESDEKKLLTNAGYKLVCSNPREKLFFPQSSYFGDRYLCGGISGRSNSVSKPSSAGPDTRRSTINSYMMSTMSYRFYSLPMDLMKRTEYPSTGSRISGQHNHHYHHHHVHNNNNNNNNNTNTHPPQNDRVDPATISKIPKDHKGYKNVFVVGVAFMFVYTAFVSLQSLQSTLNTDGGVGVVSLSCMYSATVFSCLIAPWVINKLKCKWTMVVAFVLFSCYFAANFYPKHFMLIPAGIILGLLTGPLWSAQATLVTTLGITYAQRTQNYDADAVVNKFMGIFYAFYQASQIWGNIITAAVLYSNDTLKATPDADMWLTTVSTANRSSLLTTYATYTLHNPSPLSPSSHSSMSMKFPLLPTWKKCGSKFCGLLLADPGSEYRDYNPIIEGISDDSRHMLLGVYLICGIMGAIIMMALMDSEGQNKEDICGCVSSRELCLATIKMLGDYRCQLLIPLVLFLGLQQGFLFGDFTKSYVQCTLGIYSIGLILITFGLVNAISSVVIGYIAKHIKRFAFITAAATFNAGILMVLSLWKPQPLDIPNFYVVAACLGLCDAIWQTQTFTLFGVLFMDRQEAAFASYRMFHATGCAIAFGYSYFFCVVTKVYILAVVMGVSLIAYGAIEIKLQLHHQNIKDIVAL